LQCYSGLIEAPKYVKPSTVTYHNVVGLRLNFVGYSGGPQSVPKMSSMTQMFKNAVSLSVQCHCHCTSDIVNSPSFFQFYDLLNIFALNGLPSPDNPYLFNGDFVDRGSFSVECIFVLFGFKLLYPDRFFMSRGNHESENMNKMYGFEGEVKAKYSPLMVDLFTEVYNWLPLCHCLDKKVLVMHGGLFAKVRRSNGTF
jgi:hypothetical protein